MVRVDMRWLNLIKTSRPLNDHFFSHVRFKILGYDEARLAGQAMAFYTEGTETSSIVLSYTLFELAQHPEYQQRLHDEVTTILSKHNGQVTYESLQEMQYMEWIIHESIRVHPPAFSMAKICTKPYTLPKTTGQTEPITIAPGTVALIPIFGLFMCVKMAVVNLIS